MNRLVVLAAAAFIVIPPALMLLAAGGESSPLVASTAAAPTALAQDDIPPDYLAWYQAAAQTCAGLPWQVLAGIGTVESGNGQSGAPGVHAGANFAGAEGPMQFEPATFTEYAVNADPGEPLSPYDPQDAIWTAAAMLCANGARGGTQPGIRQAIYAYNHATWYVNEVLTWAAKYAAPQQASAIAQAAISYAEQQLGKPYVWGADGPDAFDCSGLVYAAYASAGIAIGRTTFQWSQDGPVVPLDQIEPGDLLFYAGSDGTAFSRGQLRGDCPSDCVSAAQRPILNTLQCATGVVQFCYQRVAWLSCVMSSRLAARAASRS
jgi:cell wall-associated NlpC family hydrolase